MASTGEMETQRRTHSLFNANPLPPYDSFWMASGLLKLVRCKSLPEGGSQPFRVGRGHMLSRNTPR